jgi:hypothetical protein
MLLGHYSMYTRYCLLPALIFLQIGCAETPSHFDVPYSKSGVPLANSIVQRIRCELAELVRDDIKPTYNRRPTLLEYDYHASMLLSLDANETGSLTPSLNFPYSVVSFNVTPSLKTSRQDQINYNLKYSMRDIYDQWRKNPASFACPDPNTNLAGNLGIREKVSSALNLDDLAYTTEAQPTGGIFSGIINFTATKSINQAGPTWTLTHFTGPGAFLSASQVNTDKLTFGFAGGANANRPYPRSAGSRVVASNLADQALERALINNLGTQLNLIQNNIR